jgi:DNA topoisomerase-1
VPPAWSEVWIYPDANGHIQATGRDARGRKQYRYHDDWRGVRDQDKYERLIDFAKLLPRIRQRIDADMGRRGTPPEKVLATVVSLLDKTLIRVGNGEYARDNDSYGLTTLRTRHLDVQGSELRFHFKGKSGKTWRLRVRDSRIARVVRSIQDLPASTSFNTSMTMARYARSGRRTSTTICARSPPQKSRRRTSGLGPGPCWLRWRSVPSGRSRRRPRPR